MDALGLQTLASELAADVVVVVAAIDLAGRRFAEDTASGHDSAAHHLSRAYNVIAQMALRVAKVFENNKCPGRCGQLSGARPRVIHTWARLGSLRI